MSLWLRCSLSFVVIILSLKAEAQNYAPKSKYLVDSLDLSTLDPEDKQLIDSILPLYHKEKIDTIKFEYLRQIVEGCYDDKIWPLYNKYLLKAVETSLKEKNIPYLKLLKLQSLRASCLGNFGYVFSNTGEVDSAIYYYEKSLAIQREIKDLKGVAVSLVNLGVIHRRQGAISQALEDYHESLKIYESLNDSFGIGVNLGNLGLIYNHLGQTDKAIEYYNKSLRISQKLGNKSKEAGTLGNVGFIYKKLKQYDKAKENFEKALELYQSLGDENGVATAYSNLGYLAEDLKDLPKARDYFLKGLKGYRETSDKFGLATSYLALGGIEFDLNNTTLAKTYADSAYKLSAEMGSVNEMRDAADLYGRIHIRNKNWPEALKMQTLYYQLRDSVNNNEIKNQSVRKDLEYSYEKEKLELKKEQQIKDALAENEKEKHRLINIFTALGLLLALAFAVFVYFRLRITRKQKQIIESQKQIVDVKQKEIIDSINYAKRIQTALLKSEEHESKHLPPHFILFRPKDIVSGDFYWAIEKQEYLYLAAADCTGHGVPGAFLTMLGTSYLNEINAHETLLTPAEVLDKLRERFIKELGSASNKLNDDSTRGFGSHIKDGMDISMIRLNLKTNEVMWAGANNPIYFIKGDAIQEIRPDKQPIGYHSDMKPFTNHQVDVSKGDSIYIFTDGFADQFGGERGKKYMFRQLKEKLIEFSKLPMDEQKRKLNQEFDSWKGPLEQVDDICVIGLKIS